MLTFFVIVDTIIVVAMLAMAATVLVHGGYRLRRNVAMAFFCILIGAWTIANHISNSLYSSTTEAEISNYIVFSSSFTAMILVMLFVAELAGIKKLLHIARIVSPILFVIAGLSATPLVGAGVERQKEVYGVIFGPLLPLYGAALVAMMTFTLTILFIGLRHARGLRRNQLQVIGASLAVTLPLVLSLGFILPTATGVFWLTEFAIAPMIFLVAGLYYSVIKQRLFDIRFVAVRSVAYVCIIVSLSLVYYLSAYFISVIIMGGQLTDDVGVGPINIVLALFLTLIFQPLKNFFDRVTNSLFYRDSYQGVDFITRLNSLLISTTDLRGLTQRISHEISATLKAEHVSFFLRVGNSGGHYISSGMAHYSKLTLYDAELLNQFVDKYLEPVFMTDSLSFNSDVRRMLVSHKVAILLPLKSPSGIVGYLLLGEHKSGSYTKKDMDMLATISSELVITIQNAISLHEVRELNATLQQRIDVATKELRLSNSQLQHLDEVKNEFISMASHQLRTPLTSIKGYLSMVLEGDAGKITGKQEKLLFEAFKSSERMVGLIGDFLNVSRLQTGKFNIEKTDFDMKFIVEQEVSNLKLIATSHDMKIRLQSTAESLPVFADESKVRQVIMNFVDNAIYYSRPKSTIIINLERVKNDVALTVIDTGIGVPKDEQPKLFGKFFRAKNARKQRPDGTGVGLYLARRVISAHAGSIIFSSREGKGSTFGFRLPLADESSKK
ncbi:MAG: ATP-binding protein [Candidatus Saccharimonadales bacterium]